ncbi:MAG: hypothetical protein ACOC1F_03515 [Myxococcota bacterium]
MNLRHLPVHAACAIACAACTPQPDPAAAHTPTPSPAAQTGPDDTNQPSERKPLETAAADPTRLAPPVGTCAPPNQAAPPPQPQAPDTSSPFEPGDGSFAFRPVAPLRGERTVCNVVQSLQQQGDKTRFVLAGSEPEEQRAFEVRMPSRLGLPFSQGDRIRVHVRVRVLEIHRVIEALVTDAAGGLLLGHSGDGQDAFAPGWQVEVGRIQTTDEPPIPGGARRQSRNVRFVRGAQAANVAPGTWRQLRTPGGNFVLSGTAVRWTEGPRPPDASSWTSFTIVRLTHEQP